VFFVGREKELTWLARELNRGRHIVITGKYGMGKTSLVRELSERQTVVPKGSGKFNFIFLDFLRTPGEICLRLQKELSMRRDRRETACLTYRQRRSRIAVKAAASSKKHVVVLDNITALTSPKLSLIRYFILARSFQFIAVADASLSEHDFFLLRAALSPAGVLELGYLGKDAALAALASASAQHAFGWTESHLRLLAEVTKGYPLGLGEAIERELKRLSRGTDKRHREDYG